MCARRPFASVTGTVNSRLSGPASGGTRHHRRYPSLVDARRLRPKVGPENCRDRRATRRTRFSRTKPICERQRILPRLPELSRDASATATTKFYARRNPVNHLLEKKELFFELRRWTHERFR